MGHDVLDGGYRETASKGSWNRAGALLQWLKLPAWKSGDRGFVPPLTFKFQTSEMLLSRSLVNILYCGEPP